jgi:hypothetical protein
MSVSEIRTANSRERVERTARSCSPSFRRRSYLVASFSSSSLSLSWSLASSLPSSPLMSLSETGADAFGARLRVDVASDVAVVFCDLFGLADLPEMALRLGG